MSKRQITSSRLIKDIQILYHSTLLETIYSFKMYTVVQGVLKNLQLFHWKLKSLGIIQKLHICSASILKSKEYSLDVFAVEV